MRVVAADEATARAGIDYLYWFAPGLGLQFLMIAMFATLRGTGIVKPTMILQIISVLVNVVLAPVLIVGWGTGKPMGRRGRGPREHHRHRRRRDAERVLLPSRTRSTSPFIASRCACSARSGAGSSTSDCPWVSSSSSCPSSWRVIYWVIRDFGAAAQAGFGVGQGVMRIIMLPAMAVAFAAAPIAGQNFGARRPERVRETFKWTVADSVVIMLLLTVLCQFESDFFMHIFTTEAAVVAVGAQHAGDQLVELRREWRDLQLLVDVPGARQHLADHRFERRPADRVHRAGVLAIYPAGLPAGARLVPVGDEHVPAGGGLYPAAAPGVLQEATARYRVTGQPGYPGMFRPR